MRIALINPPYKFNPPKWNEGLYHVGGIAFISATLKRAGHDVKNIDLMHDSNASLEQVLNYDVVGIASYLNSYSFFKEALPFLKNNNKIIVVGGPLITSYKIFSTNLLMRTFPEIDYGVIGEGEITTERLIANLEHDSGKIPSGLLFRQNNEIKSTGIGDFIESLDDIAEIDYIDWPAFTEKVKGNVLNTSLARGCYNACSFCYNPYKLRSFSMLRIEREFEKISALKPDHVMFADQTFSYNRHRTLKIGELAQRFGLRFGMMTRVDEIDYELMCSLKQMGLTHVALGVESFDDDILMRAGKKITSKLIYSAIEQSQRAGVRTIGFILIGLPGESRKTLEKTLKGVKEAGLIPEPRILLPLPGTKLYMNALTMGWLKDEYSLLKQFSEPDKFDTKEGNWVPINLSDGLTNQELIDARDELNKIKEEFEKDLR